MKRSVDMMAIMAIGLLFCLASAPADEDDAALESDRTASTAAEESSESTSSSDVEPGATASEDELTENREARKKFFKQMRQKVAAMQKLQSEGKEEEAERLREEIRELRGQFCDSQPPGARPARAGRPWNPERAEKHRETMEKMMQTYREVRRLKEEGKMEEAEERMAELKDLRQQIARRGEHHHGHRGPNMDPEARRRHHELREKIREAKEAGDEEKARKLMEQARASARKFHEHHRGDRDRTRPGHADRDFRGPPQRNTIPLTAAGRFGTSGGMNTQPGSAEQRLRHIRMAAANLDAAGMREMANRVREEGRKVSEQIRRQHEQGGQRGMQDIQRNLRELTEEVRHLRRQVKELSQESD